MGNNSTTSWYSSNDLKTLLQQAKTGDLLEFDRGFYRHWGVYAGQQHVNGKTAQCVIHFSSPAHTTSSNVVCRSQSVNKREYGLGNVTTDPLVDVACGGKVRINNSSDENNTAETSKQILRRARRLAENYQSYNVFSNNCEHFAKFCRYGKKVGGQVEDTTSSAFAGLLMLGLGAAILVIANTAQVRRN